jgi:LmbE family N-acetylglucosaminyl deacetylase
MELSKKTILIVAPHPDDEVIACGGTIVKKIAEGYTVKIVFVTDGSHSHSAVLNIENDPPPSVLKRIRHDEGISAARVLGVDAESVFFLDAEDTKVNESLSQVRDGITKILKSCPNLIEVYIPHEQRELNNDHKLSGQVTLQCLKSMGIKPLVFKYIVWDEDTEIEFGFVNRGSSDGHQNFSDEQVVLVDIRNELQIKIDALMQHKTQVTMYSASQTRTVVPDGFFRRVIDKPEERFFVHSN